MSNRTDLTQFEGHTEGPWQTNDCDSQGVWQEHDESIPRHIAMVHSDQDWEDMTEAEFMRMMADKQLVTAAPDLLAELKRCYEREDALIEALKIIRDDLDDALETEGYNTLAHEKSERTLQKIRNFANDASE